MGTKAAQPGHPEAPSYSRLQIVLHWAIAGLILVQYLIHGPMEAAFDRRADLGAPPGLLPTGPALLHAAVGTTVLALATLRIGLRLWRGAPPSHDNVPWPALWAGQGVHLGLYLMILALPATGLWAWTFGHELAAELHERGTEILVLLVLAHVVGAATEHWFFRNDSLTRMIPMLDPPRARDGPAEPKPRAPG